MRLKISLWCGGLIPYYLSAYFIVSGLLPVILSPVLKPLYFLSVDSIPLLTYQGTLLFSLLFCRLLHMLCSSERLIFKDTCVCGTKKLDASLSSTLHTDKFSLVLPREPFTTHNTTRHTNLQRRGSSASISPVEELLERAHLFEENSRGLRYHSGTLSRSIDAKLATANKAAHEHVPPLSSQRAKLPPKLSATSLLTRYSFLHSFKYFLLYNSRFSFCSLCAIPYSSL